MSSRHKGKKRAAAAKPPPPSSIAGVGASGVDAAATAGLQLSEAALLENLGRQRDEVNVIRSIYLVRAEVFALSP